MTDIAIQIENLSKMYRLGSSSAGTLVADLNSWIDRVRGREDSRLKIDQINDRTQKAKNDFVWSLKDISFEIKKGDAVGIIGNNGAGKSTLLKILSRITSPTTGTIKMNGRVASLLEVGTGFHPELTGRENIFMNGAIMGMTRHEIRTKFDEIVDFSGCERYIDTPVKRYSSGMYVRLAFAVAAYLEPEILIVDEVLAVGDAEFQRKCLSKMDQVSRNEGRTVLFVSHNMESIRTLCTKGLLLKNGRLAGDDSITKIIELYENDQHVYSTTSLKDIVKRTGNGSLHFTDIRFLDSDGNERIQFFVGESMQIKISFDATEEFFFSGASSIDVGINNHLYNSVSWMSSNIYMNKIKDGQRSIIFKIDKVMLASGDYNFSLYAANVLGIADWVKNISIVSIVFNDYYKTGRVVTDKKISLITDFSIV